MGRVPSAPRAPARVNSGVRRQVALAVPFADAPPECVRRHHLACEALRLFVVPNTSHWAYKAAFFRSLGYEADGWETLEKDIRSLLGAAAEEIGATDYGKKYAVTGVLTGPNDRSATLVTAWSILTGEDTPRFVTADPGDELWA